MLGPQRCQESSLTKCVCGSTLFVPCTHPIDSDHCLPQLVPARSISSMRGVNNEPTIPWSGNQAISCRPKNSMAVECEWIPANVTHLIGYYAEARYRCSLRAHVRSLLLDVIPRRCLGHHHNCPECLVAQTVERIARLADRHSW